MMQTERTSETSINFDQTKRRSNPQDNDLHNYFRGNQKYHLMLVGFKQPCCLATIFDFLNIGILNAFTLS